MQAYKLSMTYPHTKEPSEHYALTKDALDGIIHTVAVATNCEESGDWLVSTITGEKIAHVEITPIIILEE
jgi:hypothetical protein